MLESYKIPLAMVLDKFLVSSMPLSFECLVEKIVETTQELSAALAEKSDPKYGSPEIDIFIKTPNEETSRLPSGISKMKILQADPVITITLFFGSNHYSEKTTIDYKFVANEKLAIPEKQKIEEGHRTEFVKSKVQQIIALTCNLILKKAQQELELFRQWEGILK